MVVKFIWMLLLVCLVTGEEDLWKKFAHECSGRSQSPIDIEVSKVKYDSSLSLSLKGFNQAINGSYFDLINNGHTVQLNLIDSFMRQEDIPIVKGPALNDKVYKFVQLHFHWHYNDSEGSEHAIDGKRYALEMHYVHINTKYNSIDEATKYKDGLAVLGTLFQITRKDNAYLNLFMKGIEKVQRQGSNTNLEGSFRLDYMLPDDLDSFFKYSGSLTTPPCSEAVTWIVYREVAGISLSQMTHFRNIMMLDDHHHHVPIGHNVRPLQNLRNREILASWSSLTSSSPVSQVSSIVVPTFISLLILKIMSQ